MPPGIWVSEGQQATFLFQRLSLCLLHFSVYFSVICLCQHWVGHLQMCRIYIISGVKLHMHIRTVSALHLLPQSNCPPIFTSTKVACLQLNDFMRYNSICHILNYMVLHLPMCLPSKHCHVMSQSHEEMHVILLVYRLIRRGRTRSHALPLCKT